jgi:3-oxoacyl-[acyl-carrier protein] reductase
MSRVVLITGTRKGIGKALAEHYLAKNMYVVGCSRGQSSLEHKNYTHYSLDISDEKRVVHMCKDILKRLARIDILVNNAGIASMNHIMLTPVKSAKVIFATNFLGTFILAREAAKAMSRRKFGRIINFTTVARPLSLEGEALYVSSKAAVEAFTKVAARELAELGITVNAIGPAPIPTSLIKTVPKDKITQLVKFQAIKRLGTMEDVINVVDFFSSEKSSFVTGQVIYLGGISG